MVGGCVFSAPHGLPASSPRQSADQNAYDAGKPSGSHAALHRYRLPVEMYVSASPG